MRMINIMFTDLTTKRLRLEEKLERLINDKGDVDTQLVEMQEVLREIVIVEQMIAKWREYMVDNKNKEENNNELKND